MTKTIIAGAAAAILLVASFASAQSYPYYSYPTYQSVLPGQMSSVACVNISRDLARGARGTDVTTLQTFLVAQNYAGSGSWMVTGYFGAATEAAVKIFQSMRGLAQTGVVDAGTRAAIAACAPGTGFTAPYTQPYTQPYQYPYTQYPYQYPYAGVSLTSITPTQAAPGSQVTIYGTGFDYSNNTIYAGSFSVANVPSYNGTTLTFTVPTYASGITQVYVTNSRGTSNTLSLVVTQQAYPTPCPGYPYSLGQYCPPIGGTPTINYITPQQGAVGSTVTIYGSGFSTTGNTVRFGNGIIVGVGGSYMGNSISFTVPSQLTGYGSQPVTLGTYQVSVSNAQGVTSNAMPFTVTSLGSYGAPSITSVTGPTTLAAGTSGTWTVQVNAPINTYTTLSVRWGDEHLYGYALSAPQSQYVQTSQSFNFSHAYTAAGTYTVTFTATGQNGQQNTSTATVTVTPSGATGQVTLGTLSPLSGRVGTQVLLQGTGFTAYDNTVHFGTGGSRNIASFNSGTQIYFTIPSWISPCDPNATICTMQAIAVTPGTYPMRVSNVNGTTQTIYFTVTN